MDTFSCMTGIVNINHCLIPWDMAIFVQEGKGRLLHKIHSGSRASFRKIICLPQLHNHLSCNYRFQIWHRYCREKHSDQIWWLDDLILIKIVTARVWTRFFFNLIESYSYKGHMTLVWTWIILRSDQVWWNIGPKLRPPECRFFL